MLVPIIAGVVMFALIAGVGLFLNSRAAAKSKRNEAALGFDPPASLLPAASPMLVRTEAPTRPPVAFVEARKHDAILGVELNSTTPTRDCGALWCAWMAVVAQRTTLEDGDWLPLGVVGATLLVGHDNAEARCPFPSWAVQKCRLHSEEYIAVRSGFCMVLEDAQHAATEFDRPEIHRIEAPDECISSKLAAEFLLAHGVLTRDARERINAFLAKPDWSGLAGGLAASVRKVESNAAVCSPATFKRSLTVQLPPSLNRPFAWPFGERQLVENREIYVAFREGVPEHDAYTYEVHLIAELRELGWSKPRVLRCIAPEWELTQAIAELGMVAPAQEFKTGELARSLDENLHALRVRATTAVEVSPNKHGILTGELVEWILATAISRDATDIHFDVVEEQGRVRFRVDGILRVAVELPVAQFAAAVQQVRDKSKCNIAINWRPQDGRMNLLWIDSTATEKVLNIRTSVYPNRGGIPTVVLRILKKEVRSFEELGLNNFVKYVLTTGLNSEKGFMVFSGPTGSGKTSTMNSALQKINDPSIKIITAEDPIEYEMEGITQGQIDIARGVTATECIRSILRQDPDVAMVGELRDLEMTKLAFDLSNTGHNVMGTLHANDEIAVISRLRDLGVPAIDLVETVTVVSAQRLLSRLCKNPSCRIQRSLSEREKVAFEREIGRVPKFVNEVRDNPACPICGGTGVKGRVLVLTALPMVQEFQDAILAGARAGELRALRDKLRFPSLFTIALEKVANGELAMKEANSQEYLWVALPDPRS